MLNNNCDFLKKIHLIDATGIANELQKLQVNHVSTEKCAAVHNNYERIVPAAHSRHLCAGGIEGIRSLLSKITIIAIHTYYILLKVQINSFLGEDSCGGDSGGPLMLEQKNRGKKNFTLVGTVSWGLEECGQRSMPGIYADVPYFLEWILNNIE